MTVPVFLLDAFPARAFGGNIAGVVLVESPAPDDWMQAIAAELGAPTTGFVDLPGAPRGEVHVRFFTPRREIDACGHVTVAIATVLVEQGAWTTGAVVVVAAGGRYPLVLDVDESGVRVEMQQELLELERQPTLPDLAALLGPAAPARDLAPVVGGTGLRHLLVPVETVEDLGRLPMDPGVIAGISAHLGVDTIGVYTVVVVAQRVVEVRMRDLCAGIGATEEAASGTTTGTIAFALADAGLLTAARPRLRLLMGVEMDRPSSLSVELDFAADRAVRARLHGRATTVLAGTVACPQ